MLSALLSRRSGCRRRHRVSRLLHSSSGRRLPVWSMRSRASAARSPDNLPPATTLSSSQRTPWTRTPNFLAAFVRCLSPVNSRPPQSRATIKADQSAMDRLLDVPTTMLSSCIWSPDRLTTVSRSVYAHDSRKRCTSAYTRSLVVRLYGRPKTIGSILPLQMSIIMLASRTQVTTALSFRPAVTGEAPGRLSGMRQAIPLHGCGLRGFPPGRGESTTSSVSELPGKYGRVHPFSSPGC